MKFSVEFITNQILFPVEVCRNCKLVSKIYVIIDIKSDGKKNNKINKYFCLSVELKFENNKNS